MARFLSGSLKSILNNSFKGVEIIIIDDGSTDHTAEVVNNVRKQACFPIQYHKVSHRGKAACINAVFTNLSMAGEFITFMDADDMLPSCSLQKRFEAISLSGTDFIIGEFAVTNSHGKDLETRHLDPQVIKKELLNQFFFHPRTPFHLNGVIISKKLFLKTGHFDEMLYRGQEVDYAVRLLKTCHCFGILPEVVYHYRKHPRALRRRINLRAQTIYYRLKMINKHLRGTQKLTAISRHGIFDFLKLGYDLYQNYDN